MNASNNEIRVYSLPDCPKCETLKEWLKTEGIEYEAKWFDTEAQTDFIMRNFFDNPPILTKNDIAKGAEDLFEGEKLKEDYLTEVLGIG
jgi:glutaredoxin